MTNTTFLNFMQRHHRIMIWASIYCIMVMISFRHLELLGSLILSAITMAPMIIMALLLQYVLLPRLFHHRLFMFGMCCIALIGLLAYLFTQFDIQAFEWVRQMQGPDYAMSAHRTNASADVNHLFLHSKYWILLLCTTATLSIDYLLTERRHEAEAFHEQKMQEQLKYLRAQINPHFLFNALNCIYSLSITQDEKAPDSVLKLSEMLRYVIDDCRADSVPLTKEVRYIRNYIDFQRIRMEHEPNLTFDVQQTDPDYTIPPMILQPIIENCFKHSRLVDDPMAWIHIAIRQNESGLLFTCDNSKPAATSFSRQSAIIGRQDEERTGIGLLNVQQRLAMLFGNKCSLKVIEDDQHYKTVLHI